MATPSLNNVTSVMMIYMKQMKEKQTRLTFGNDVVQEAHLHTEKDEVA